MNPLPDIFAKNLDVIFCGLNPGLSAAEAGHHFLGKSNRFWRVLYLAGFTPEQILAENDRKILQHGCGITAVVGRPTARAAQLSPGELRAAGPQFEEKIAHHAPRFVAFLGKAAYCALSGRREVAWGSQPEKFGGATAWVLPNPSGRNLSFSLEQLVDHYRLLYRAAALNRRPEPNR